MAARDLTDEERRGFKEIKWDDREVCAFYMVRFCPHDLFVNTKSDLGLSLTLNSLLCLLFISFIFVFCFSGACSRIHDPKLKERLERLDIMFTIWFQFDFFRI